MVVIRLARSGTKKRPFYYLVVTDKRNRRDGRFIEQLGFYNPEARGQSPKYSFKQDRIQHWLNVGAKPSERVSKILKTAGKPAPAAA